MQIIGFVNDAETSVPVYYMGEQERTKLYVDAGCCWKGSQSFAGYI